ncbi:2,3,4,5-tetrahydropyridine-2,6-dicarboxylate N-acetyltransferase [Propionicimonas sp. T2.31MG-18]|uniref:acyltransferase n=1 Tax=Propionicimonas sp. T2.31MG-18 TaxID=3157620 RepID=UPI0035E59DFF
MTFPNALVSSDVRITGDVSRLVLADGVSIFGPSVIVLLDGGGLSGSRLEVGEGTFIGEFANLRTAGAPITIGARCLLGQGVTIVGTNHGTRLGTPIVDQEWVGSGVEIGDDVWIASNSIIVAGARIASGAVIAANSVVRGDVPENAIMAGSPARQVGERRPG